VAYDPAVVAEAYRTAKGMGASPKVMLALFEAGIVESGMRNLPGGDRDSIGFLQQRPSQGWTGLTDVSKATREFVTRAQSRDRPWMTAGMLAQSVQRSKFPLKYDAVKVPAMLLIERARGGWGLDDLTLADEALEAGGIVDDVGTQIQGAAQAAGEAVVTLKKASVWLADRENWVRISKVVVGVGLVYVGLAMVLAPRLGKPLGKLAGLTGVGKAVSAAKSAST